jgi:RES domain-containing protein
MSEFKSWQSYWHFSHATKHGFRYIQGNETREFLNIVLATSMKRAKTIREGTILWRAQLGSTARPLYSEDGEHVGDEDSPFHAERMKPQLLQAAEGRVNPKGIPYLYLSDNKETALAEVRPWIGSKISVGQFKVLKSLRIVDCSVNTNTVFVPLETEEPEPAEREEAVWADIDTAFSEPVTRSDQQADYIPTQIIAELFKHNGVDGVLYKSSVSRGRNVALFDLDSAAIVNCVLYSLQQISFEFEQEGGTYYPRQAGI